MTSQAPEPSRYFPKVDAVYFSEWLDTQPSTAEAAEFLGVSRSSIATWQRNGKCPVAIELLCEKLVQEAEAANPTPAHSLYLISVPAADQELFLRIVTRLGFKPHLISEPAK